MNINQLTVIFCQIDDFCKEFDRYASAKLLPSPMHNPSRGPRCGLSHSEIMTILIFFQASGYRDFKRFYVGLLSCYYKRSFPQLPSYQRFIELIHRVFLPLILFTQLHAGKRSGIYYVDSTCLPVCHLKRSRRHRTFDQLADYSRTSVGWFFGLKLHLVINHRGELIAFKLTRANQHDAHASKSMLAKLTGLAFGDKGYISKQLCDYLLSKGLKLITRCRKNMKPRPLASLEKQLLQKRGMIETVIEHLKHHFQVWHTRHRSIANAITHLVAALAAYSIKPLSMSAIRMLNCKQVNKIKNLST